MHYAEIIYEQNASKIGKKTLKDGKDFFLRHGV